MLGSGLEIIIPLACRVLQLLSNLKSIRQTYLVSMPGFVFLVVAVRVTGALVSARRNHTRGLISGMNQSRPR